MAADVRVRLSAEGVADVVSALKTVQEQAARTASGSKGLFGGLNQVLGLSTELMQGLGLAVGAVAFVQLAVDAAKSAEALQENAAAAGTTTARFEALAVVTLTNGANAEYLRNVMSRLAAQVDALGQGSAKATAPFAKLGLTAKDFAGLDSAQQFELVSRALAKIPDGAQKTAVAYELLGRNGARAIPIMNALAAAGGLAGAEQQAQALGLALSDDVVAGAARASRELTLLKEAIGNVATQFVAGLSPAFDQTFRTLSGDMRDAQGPAHALGAELGILLNVLNAILGLAVEVIDAAQTGVTVLVGLFATASGAIVGLFAEGQDAKERVWRQGLAAIDTITGDFVERTKNRFAALTAPILPPPPNAGGGSGGTTIVGEEQKAFDRRLAATRQFVEAQKKLTETLARNDEQTAKQRFDLGLTSATEYYNTLTEIAQASADAQIKGIETVAKVEATNPDKKAAIAATKAAAEQIKQLNAQAAGERQKLSFQQLEEVRKEALERVKLEGDVFAAQGKTFEASKAQIADRIAQLRATPGLTDAEVQKKIDQLEAALTAGAAFDEQVRQFQLAADDLAQGKLRVAQDVEAGRVSEKEGQQEILALERQRLPVLQQLAEFAVVAAEATGDPAKIAQAHALADGIRDVGVAASQSATLLKNMHQEIGDILLPALTNFFSVTDQGFGNLKDKALAAVSSIITAIQNLLAQIIALKILEGLGFSFKGLPGKAAGGLMEGPGTGVSDSIVARLSAGEYVVRAAVVSQPGMLAALEAVNRGAGLSTLAPMRSAMPRFAEGGIVGAPATSPLDGKLTVELGEGLVAAALHTRGGTRALIEVMQKNRASVNRAIGG